ncbi:MAG: ThuA domain-containing protein [Gemmatimonadetes bacterium]|nr:ThuA domain-containing protein [Gemmatimonadota bacterium]
MLRKEARRFAARAVHASFLAILLCSASAFGQEGAQPRERAQGPAGAQAQRVQVPPGPRIRAAVVAGGCCHDYPGQTATLMHAVEKVLPVDWTFLYIGGTNGQHVPALYDDPNWFKGYDIIVHNECYTPGDTLISQRYLQNIGLATRAGIPAMVIHCAMHTFRAEPTDEWREVQGVKSVRHGPATRVPMKVAAPKHPIMQGIPAEWLSPVDEIYILDRVYPGTVTLATAVEPSNSTEYAVVWTHQAQGARVFGTSIGHSNATWADPVYQQLLTQGFKWAVGR